MSENEDPSEAQPTPESRVAKSSPTSSTVVKDYGVVVDRGNLWIVTACIAAIVVLADVCLFQGDGYFGPAVFFVVAAAIFGLGIPGRARIMAAAVTAILLVVTAWRLAWCGNVLAMVLGYWLLFAYCLSLRGQSPYLLRVFGFIFECVPGSLDFVRRLEGQLRARFLPEQTNRLKGRTVEYLLPVIAVLIFGSVFVMANADVVQVVSSKLSLALDSLNRFFRGFTFGHLMFWLVVTVLATGILRPVAQKIIPGISNEGDFTDERQSPLYSAFRNTLIAVIVVFGAYLLFELRAFTAGKPPEGFTYSSYAHEGAAWLTVALGLSTLTLSLIFRGDLLRDDRYRKLERLAWAWSSLNFLLAVAVINRMWIYVGYNGMTRMRVVGFLGITAVLLGFVLVLVKIRRRHNFRWLLRRQCWVAGLMVWIFSVLPVDVLIHRYNVKAILAGNPAPIVQITEHPFDDECLAELVPLCSSKDQLVANGIKAIIRLKSDGLTDVRFRRQSTRSRFRRSGDNFSNWTEIQWYEASLRRRLNESKFRWDSPELTAPKANSQWSALKKFALQNYW